MVKKYLTEEERLAARRASSNRFYYKHRDEILAKQAEHKTEKSEYDAKRYQEQKKNITEEQKQSKRERERLRYQNDEEYRARRLASSKLWKDKHKNEDGYKEKKRKNERSFRDRHKDDEEYKTKNKRNDAKYRSSKKGRATSLLHSYRQKDELRNRGECTLTADWIVENVFSGQCCNYCGESDWMKLGVDRIDNELPHTPENCVPCCWDCNNKRKNTEYDEFMRLIKKVG